ncbi:hypothetical protein Syun_021676 [Stephania yunnanensis]|uniref:Uncharacterized protein n=1 Tax=Stephania yunnanensis TaxID=152371 RepID=A0AAP0NQW2_9MAGN
MGAANNVGDYVPFLAPFDLQGLVRGMKAASMKYDELVEKIIEKHMEDAKEHHKKFSDY